MRSPVIQSPAQLAGGQIPLTSPPPEWGLPPAPDNLRALSLLVVEDSDDDYALIGLLLKEGGFRVRSQRVESAAELAAALKTDGWDCIISDYNLPSFDGVKALQLLQESGRDIPLIIVSGVIGEESAVAAMRAGARDYVLKSNLLRLAPAVHRELTEACERRRAREREHELERLKSGFVSLVSHEFRTPLAIISTANQMLARYAERLTPAERQEKLAEIQEGVTRMTALMEDVLLGERIKEGKLTFKPEPIDLAAWCRHWCDDLSAAHGRTEPITLQAEAVPASINLDRKLVQTILSNLLSNAIKYSAPNAPIRLSIRRAPLPGRGAAGPGSAEADCLIVFQVQDHGIGIPAAELPKLFDAFHRCTNVGGVPGTGLGLSIVKQCAQLHGGGVEVQSQLRAGSTFIVSLPARESASTEYHG